ncbi:DNA topoisomerase III [Prolixibacter bellariivorans]|uniref:DNA topoisomerase n=1 Tax=Prolixibacter bellariivorans TaxID=314319 RepID=A0A5M4AUN9_9BACT|nr:type IA DNA topoisomerase [Prolixibacter bellariivorans]GET31655.1 DNA topoisomerase III [Prolixibacter bellariivorans]
MKVCIAEKPSVAREIADILGAKSRRDGYFEGNGYQVTWTFGHLCTLKEPHDYTSRWKWWDLRTLPMLPRKFGIKLIDDEGVKKQFNTIEKLVNEADEVINCGDAGQEGEVIQRWVLTKAKCQKPIKRLWISSLTEEAIKEGFEKLYNGTDFDLLYAAGSARAIGDWLLGLNATRLYTLKYGQNKQVLSIGRVQTPTLALVVQRQLEIDNFKPEPYWELKTTYRETVFSATSGRFSVKEEAEKKLEEIKGHDLFITSVETKKGTEQPQKLFDLTSLQVESNRKFGLSADETLRVIQSLYEKKVTTYPRVDTTFLPNDIYPKVPGILKKLKPYEQLTEPLLKDKIRKSKKVFDDKKITDHHAIIPTGVFTYNLTPDEKRVFDLVARRFISVFYPDCKVANTTVLATVNEVDFKVTGKQILHPGWRVVYQSDGGKTQADENILPAFVKGESGPHEPDLAEKMTQPPRYYSEATLLRAMETAGKQVDDDELRELMKENGIGRPSTRANIIETLFRRRYIMREKKRILATKTGIDLIGSIENDLLKSAELTGQWEKKLRLIEEGTYEVSQFMEEMKQMVSEIVDQVKRSPRKEITIIEDEKEEKSSGKAAKKEKAEKEVQLTCPKCGKGTVLKGKSAWGCSAFRDGCDFRLPFELLEKKLTDNQIKQLIEKKKTGVIKGFTQGGEKVDGKLVLTDDFNIELEEKEEEKLTCPKCKQGTIVKGKTAWGCTNFQNCSLRIPFSFMNKGLTDNQVKQLILKGKTSKIKGFESPDGSKSDGNLQLNENFELKLS